VTAEVATLPARADGRAWLRRTLQARRTRVAFLLLLLLFAGCLLVPALSPWAFDRTDLSLGAQPPSRVHWMGTDDLGRDLCVRVFLGGRVSLAAAFFATTAAVLVGVPLGALSGYRGGRLDTATLRALQAVQALPFLVIVILLQVFLAREGGTLHRSFRAVLGPFVHDAADPRWYPVFRVAFLCALLGLFWWPSIARATRGQVMALRSLPFVEAARALGTGHTAILFRHLLPNALGPILAQATLVVPEAMVAEAALSFLGLGADEPLSSWGGLVARGAEAMDLYPWLLVFPAMFLVLAAFCLHVLGDALREAAGPGAAFEDRGNLLP
jgi:oligopeptide transport system permease protein